MVYAAWMFSLLCAGQVSARIGKDCTWDFAVYYLEPLFDNQLGYVLIVFQNQKRELV